MTRGRRQHPPAPAPSRPVTAFAPGDRVVLTGGMSAGSTGILVERWSDLGGLPHWRVDLPDARDRVLREDFLEKVVG